MEVIVTLNGLVKLHLNELLYVTIRMKVATLTVLSADSCNLLGQ